METLRKLRDSLIEGEVEEVKRYTRQALDEGIPAKTILDQGLVAGMDVVGVKFREGEYFLPEVLLCAKAMHAGLDILKPLLAGEGEKSVGTIVLGTVKGDLHDIGKRIVKAMLEGAGYEVIDIGVDVDAEKFVESVKKYKPLVLGMSALLTTTMRYMKTVIDALQDEGIRDKVKIIVGGAPVNEEFAKLIGADGYAPNASEAVDLVRRLIAA
ncbi:MAG TPA: cobalamin-binding protein [Thermotogae bacterium]|nr:cobalamin-binding protein [Thermotogota bacterium]